MDLTAVEAIGSLPDGITHGMLTVAAVAANDRLEQEAWEDFMSLGVDE